MEEKLRIWIYWGYWLRNDTAVLKGDQLGDPKVRVFTVEGDVRPLIVIDFTDKREHCNVVKVSSKTPSFGVFLRVSVESDSNAVGFRMQFSDVRSESYAHCSTYQRYPRRLLKERVRELDRMEANSLLKALLPYRVRAHQD